MIHKIACNFTDLVISHSNNESSRERYIYGFEIIICKALIYTILFIMGIFLHLLPEMLIYVSYVMLLRGQSGGYHMKNSIICIFSTVALSGLSVLAAKNIEYHLAVMIFPIPVFISVLIICFYTPINHPNLLLNIQEMHKCAKCTWIIIGTELLSIALMLICQTKPSIIISACLAIIIVAIFMIVAKIKKQEIVYHE